MRLLLVVSQSDYFWSHREALAREARSAGFEVHVATRLVTPREEFQRVGLHIHPIDFPRGFSSPLRQLGAIRQLAKLYREIAPDLVHHVSVQVIVLGGLAARFAQVPHVVNAFTGLGALATMSEGQRQRHRLAWTLLKAAHARHHVALFQNPEDLSDCVRRRVVRPSHAVLIRGSGVDVRRFTYGERSPESVVLFAGRLIRPKGIGEFVEASRLLRRRFPDARFVVAGEPDRRNAASCTPSWLRDQERAGLIEWCGKQSEMAALYHRAAVVALPTWYGEGVPKVLLEAAACGRPLVATNTRGCREIVLPDRTGYRVALRDPRQLAHAISRILRDAELQEAMGRAARALVVARFSDQFIARQTIAVHLQELGALPTVPAGAVQSSLPAFPRASVAPYPLDSTSDPTRFDDAA